MNYSYRNMKNIRAGANKPFKSDIQKRRKICIRKFSASFGCRLTERYGKGASTMDSLSTIVENFRASDGVAHIFGVMLYTDEHPNIKKVLRDDDYWQSFHELTGDRFCVFSVKPKKGVYEMPSPPPGMCAMMMPIWHEPSDNKKLLEVFELEDTKSLPMLILFTIHEGEYLKIELKLDDSSVESAYKSIKEQLEFSCNAINQIKVENLNNPQGLYAALSMHNDHKNKWSFIKKGIDIYAYIKNLLP